MSGHSSFEDFIAGVERLSRMNAEVAKAALEPVTEAARASASAGETPTGEAWAPLADGGQALPGAAGAITSSATGTRIELRVGKPYVFHQHGAGGHSTTKEAERARAKTKARQAKTGTNSKFHAPRRQILPDPGDAIPGPMKEALREAAAVVFGKAVG